jgi:hypothetical protein
MAEKETYYQASNFDTSNLISHNFAHSTSYNPSSNSATSAKPAAPATAVAGSHSDIVTPDQIPYNEETIHKVLN